MASYESKDIFGFGNDLLEERVTMFKNYLKKNLKVLDLILSPCLQDVILKEKEAIMWKGMNDQPWEAATMFLEAFCKSKKTDKWSRLKEALNVPEHALIVDILKRGETRELRDHDRQQRQLEPFKKDIMDVLNTSVACPLLQQEGLLSDVEYQKINARRTQDGDSLANFLILLYVPRNKDWYPKFMRILWRLGHCKLVRNIDEHTNKELKGELEMNQDQLVENLVDAIGADSGHISRRNSQVNIVCVQNNFLEGPVASRLRSRTLHSSQTDVSQAASKLSNPSRSSYSSQTRSISGNEQRRSVSGTFGFISNEVLKITNAAKQSNDQRKIEYLPVNNFKTCTVCGMNFVSNDELSQHQLKHRKDDKLLSSTLTSKDKNKLEVQRSASKNISYNSQTEYPQSTGQEDHSGNNNELKLTRRCESECDTCQKTFSSEKGMKIHRTKMHGRQDSVSYTSTEAVFQLGKSYRTPCTAVIGKTVHAEKVQLKRNSSKYISSVEESDLENDSVRKPFTTSENNTIFPKESKRYSTSTEEESEFECEVCKSTFTSKNGMRIHRTKMHGPKYSNNVTSSHTQSDGIRSSRNDLTIFEQQKREHIPCSLKPEESLLVQCTLCEKLFSTERGMKIHRTSVHGKQVVNRTLSFDERSLSNSSSLSSIEWKSKKSANISSLDSATEATKNDQPPAFKCTLCDRLFTTERGMKIHRTKTHH